MSRHNKLSVKEERKVEIPKLLKFYNFNVMDPSYDPIDYLKRSLELNPKNYKAAQLHATYLISKRNFGEAVNYLNQFLSNFEEQAHLRNLLASAYLHLNKIEEAEESIHRALSYEPRSKEILYTAFLIKKKKGDKFSALHFLERILSLNDQSIEILYEMAELLDSNAELLRKINVLEVAYASDPRNRKVFQELIECLLKYFEDTPKENFDPPIIREFLKHLEKGVPSYFPSLICQKITRRLNQLREIRHLL
jgi:tetratricopeptide (TPR) repeat protein